MKNLKNISIFLFIFVIAIAVSVAGCLGNDANNADGNLNNSIDSDENSNHSESGQVAESKSTPSFDANLTLVNSVPQNFSFLSTTTVKSHGQRIGITDALFGYQGIYHYGNDRTPVFLTFYDVTLSSSSQTSNSYIQSMIDSHKKQYGDDSSISTIQINGRDAVLLTAETAETPQNGRHILVWGLGNMFVTVTGNVGSDSLIELAEATGY